MIKSKKASVSPVEDLVEYLFKLTLIIAVFTVVFLLIKSFIVYDVDIFEAESNVLADRLLYGKNSLSYYDGEINRLYPGIIDLEKFTKENASEELDKAIYFSVERHFSAELIVYDVEGNTYGPIYVNEDNYLRWLPIARTHGKGPGGAKMIEKSFYVLLMDKRYKDIVNLERLEELKEMDSWVPFGNEEMAELERLKTNPIYDDVQLIPGQLIIKVIIPNS